MTAPKKKGKTGRASATNSPALHSAAFPPLDDDEEQAYLLKMEENDNDGDYTAGGAGKPKKPASGSKKPVSSSSTSGAAGKQPAPTSAGASKAGPGAKEKGKETKRSGSMKLEDSEEALFTAEKRGARGRAGSSKKVVEEVEEEEEELVEEDGEEEDDGVTRCVCDEDNDDLSSGLMIECDTCKCWQHGPCVGLWNEKDCPDRYFCELCRPSWHGPGGILRKAHRKNAGPPPPPAGHRRSPSVTSTSHAPSQARNKPRESADAALISAFLANDAHPSAAERERDSQSPSPPPPTKSKKDEPIAKKRSTMNSRDAAYDDAIAMSILGPGSAAMRARLAKSSRGGDGSNASGSGAEEDEEDEDRPNKSRRSRSGDSPVADDEHGSKRRRMSVDGDVEDQMDVEEPEETLEDARREYEANEARRQAEAEAEAAEREPSLPPPPLPSAPARAKHPNQYTYRPKNGAGGGGSSRTARASPVKRTTKDSSSSKGDTAYNGGGGSTSGGAAFLGGVVENLIRSQRPRDWTPQEGGWGMPDHLKHLSHILPTPTPTPLIVPAPTTYSMSAQGVEQIYEQPTKVRFPNKRMTMPEMKKRARNVLEYLGRVEVEMSERAERRALLKKAGEVQERERRREAGEDVGDEVESSGAGEKREQSETVKAMDALTRELHEFQRKFWGEVE